MSSNLIWEPENRKTNSLTDKLKFILRARYGEPVRSILDASDVNYLEGLRDGGVHEAQILLDAIKEYKRIDVREVY